ncbi:hypothetical protein RsoM2USA_329 [Ralstonia phage RsoM2USA]|nr:hypothetical protein RsoM2USA_329 [Ralstonia phage RsoM2USA]
MKMNEILDGYEDSDTMFDYLVKFDAEWITHDKHVKFKSLHKKPPGKMIPSIENGVADFENGKLNILARNAGAFRLPFRAKNVKEFECRAGIESWADALGATNRIKLSESNIIPPDLGAIPDVSVIQVNVPTHTTCNGSISHWFDGHLKSASFGIESKIAILRLEDWDQIRIDYVDPEIGSWRVAIANDAFELQDWLIEHGYESIA